MRSRVVPVAAVLLGAVTSLAASPVEAPFLAENDAAMQKIMAAMEITPSGDVDRAERRYLVIAPATAAGIGAPVQIQAR